MRKVLVVAGALFVIAVGVRAIQKGLNDGPRSSGAVASAVAAQEA